MKLNKQTLAQVNKQAALPTYDRAALLPGIVHLGLGAFHRAHQAVYTDTVLAQGDLRWGIVGVSLRSPETRDALAPQDHLYTLAIRGTEGEQLRVIGSLVDSLVAPESPAAVLAAMRHPHCHVVSLTVTEKGYGLTGTGRLDAAHPDIAQDLAQPQSPQGVIGLIAAALALRQQKGLPAFTVLSCDNLPQNGRRLREAVLEFAALAHDPSLVRFIEAHAAFPSGVVDRITPIPGKEVFELARAETGYDDLAAIETEPFRQWILEDSFCAGRPAWEAAGALFVPDILDYERMKLWMLNGTHSLIAYAGCLHGKAFVRDVMADPRLSEMVSRHLQAASMAIGQLGIDLETYAETLKTRFSNPAIAHATAQIAMDGTQKLPQRIIAPAFAALKRGTDFEPFAFAIAVWIAYVERWAKGLAAYEVSDPQGAVLREELSETSSDVDLLRAASAACPHVLPAELLDGKFGAALLRHIGTVRA